MRATGTQRGFLAFLPDGHRRVLWVCHHHLFFVHFWLILPSLFQVRPTHTPGAGPKLPPLNIRFEFNELDAQERDFYESIYKRSRSQFDTYVDRGTLLHNYAHIFDLLARLRQAVDHPYLVVHGGQAAAVGCGREEPIETPFGKRLLINWKKAAGRKETAGWVNPPPLGGGVKFS